MRGIYAVKLDQTHNMHSLLVLQACISHLCVFTQTKDKRIFHLSTDVIQAMGEFDSIFFLVLVKHPQLDVELLCLFYLLKLVKTKVVDVLQIVTMQCKSSMMQIVAIYFFNLCTPKIGKLLSSTSAGASIGFQQNTEYI